MIVNEKTEYDFREECVVAGVGKRAWSPHTYLIFIKKTDRSDVLTD